MTIQSIKYLTEAYEKESLVFGVVPYSPCNLRCGFCCTNNGEKIEGALPFEYYKKLFKDNIDEIGVAYVLSMGEPLLQPNKFFDMVEPVLEADKPVVLFTNGIKIDKKLAKRLVENKIGIVGKLYSGNKKLNEELVGRCNLYGDYVRLGDIQVPEYVAHLLEQGIDKDNFSLNTVIMKLNLEDMGIIRQCLNKAGISHFAEFPDISGRMENEKSRTVYLPEQWLRELAIEEYSKLDNYNYDLDEDERHLDIRLPLYRQGNVMFIGPTGNVITPKKGIVAKGEYLGNLQETCLDEILSV